MSKILATILAFATALSSEAQTIKLDLRAPAAAKSVSGAPSSLAAVTSEATLRETLLPTGAAALARPCEVGDIIEFALFDDVSVAVRLVCEDSSAMPGCGKVFLGTTAPADSEEAALNAVIIDGADGISASITDPATLKMWNIYSTGKSVKTLEADTTKVSLGCECPEVDTSLAPAVSANISGAPEALANTTKVNIDMLIAYDIDAAAWAEENGGITNFATMAIARMNAALANTGLSSAFSFRLVDVMEVGTSAGTSVQAALPNLFGGNGAYAAVKARRDAVGADVVSMFIDTLTDTGTTGVGYSLKGGSVSAFGDWAYNVCAVRAVSTSLVLAHETGHNMGAGHSDTQAQAPGPQRYDYSSGYYFVAGGENYHTIMAYDTDGHTSTHYNPIPYFSSPLYTYKGVATGDATHNNTLTLLNTCADVAAFRAEGGTQIEGEAYTPSTWMTTREEAFAAARAQGKKIFLIYGRDTCWNTMTTKDTSCEAGNVKPRLAKDYVLWYSNCDTQRAEASRYFWHLGGITLPGIAVIDPDYEDTYIVCDTDYHTANELVELLDSVEKTPFPAYATDGTSTQGVQVTWPAATGAESYNVWRCGDYWDDVEECIASGLTTLEYFDTRATPGKLYWYSVEAISGGKSYRGGEADTGYRKLTAPQNLSVAPDEDYNIYPTLKWDAVEGAKYYLVYRATDPDAVPELFNVIWDGSTEATDWAFMRGELYFYTVIAAGDAEWTDDDDTIFTQLGEESEMVCFPVSGEPDVLERIWSFKATSSGLTIVGCEPNRGAVEVPSAIEGIPVTALADYVFFNASNMTSVVIPDSVKSIGTKAFSYCARLKTVEMPKSLATLGQGAFRCCSSLEEIVVPPLADNYLWSSTFENCTSLKRATLPEGITAIGTSTFANCKSLEEVNIPSSVKTVKSFAFFSCESLAEVALPAGLNEIQMKAFKNCTAMREIDLPNIKTLGSAAFFNTGLVEATVPGSVAKVQDYCFQKCASLKHMTLSEGVQETGLSVWANDGALESFTAPSTLRKLGGYAFFRCPAFGDFTVPNGVTTIGEKAFKHCSAMQNLVLGTGVTAVPAEMCNYCTSLKQVRVLAPGGLTSIGLSAFSNCPALRNRPKVGK